MTLNTTAASGGDAWLYLQNGATLDNVNNTIQGSGIIYNNGTTLTNEAGGQILANSTGSPLIGTLSLDYGTVNNVGFMGAAGNGTLRLYSTSVNDGGGNITSNGADVQVYGSTVVGGTLNTLAGGTMESIGTSVLDASTLGALTLSSGSTYTTAAGNVTEIFGTINNQGNFQVSGGGGSNTYLYTTGNTTWKGMGTLTLSTTTASGGSAWLYLENGATLDNVNNTIQGSGIIYNNGTTLTNEAGGQILANSTGSPLANALALEYGTFNNKGLMEATNNGTLYLYSTTVNNAGANITASGSGASVPLVDTDIVGGTLNNNGGLFFGTVAGNVATLDGSTAGAVTMNGTYTADVGSLTYLYGSIVNNGNFQVNGGGGSNTYLYVPGNVTLTGGGTVTLATTAASSGNAWLYLYNGSTLDNVNNTIQGEGVIYNNGTTLINETGGTILANSTGSPLANALALEYGTFNNKGLMEATNNGVLYLYSTTVNNAGGNITASGSGASVQLVDTDIVGGTLNNNGGLLSSDTATGYAATLDGSTARRGHSERHIHRRRRSPIPICTGRSSIMATSR